MNESFHTESARADEYENSDRPGIATWIVSVEVGGEKVEREFTDEQEAKEYLESEMENPGAVCSIREQVEEMLTE